MFALKNNGRQPFPHSGWQQPRAASPQELQPLSGNLEQGIGGGILQHLLYLFNVNQLLGHLLEEQRIAHLCYISRTLLEQGHACPEQ